MGFIHPFGAYLPTPETATRVVAPPYDSLAIEETHRDVAGNPLNFLNVVRGEIDHPEHTAEERRELLETTAARLDALLASDAYEHHGGPIFIVCRLEMGNHVQTGVIADVDLAAFVDGRVRVHERTRRGQEDRLVEFMEAVRANFLPVFLFHRASADVERAVAEATEAAPHLSVFPDDGLRMTLWIADEHTSDALGDALLRLDKLYVADGHHRAAAAVRHRATPDTEPGAAAQRLLSVLFPSDHLVVHPYHRVIRDLGGNSAGAFLETLGESFDVTEHVTPRDGTVSPRAPGDLAVLLDQRWYRVRLPAGAGERVQDLDVAVLHRDILEPMLGISDVRRNERIEFVPGTLGLGALEEMCAHDYAAAFALAPMDIEQLMAIADRGELMPPKSTWFAPKLRSGLVMRLR